MSSSPTSMVWSTPVRTRSRTRSTRSCRRRRPAGGVPHQQRLAHAADRRGAAAGPRTPGAARRHRVVAAGRGRAARRARARRIHRARRRRRRGSPRRSSAPDSASPGRRTTRRPRSCRASPPTVAWTDLAEAAFALKGGDAGIPWVATNTDWTIPQARGTAPGNGTLVSAVHTAVGRLPVVAGKPERAIFDAAVARFDAVTPLFIGDRLDTDILGACAPGWTPRSC